MPTPVSVTPMLQQYFQAKSEVGDAILFFRLGDFYEMFSDDAIMSAEILDIALTSRDAGSAGRIPMCGVPFHSAEGYIARLLASGHRVAICEQVEDPKEAKGLVRREIVRTISPGTVMDASMLEERRNNYLAAVTSDGKSVGLAYVDITTGQFLTTQLHGSGAQDATVSELVRLRPAEVLFPAEGKWELLILEKLQQYATPTTTRFAPEAFSPSASRQALQDYFGVVSLEGYGCDHLPLATAAAGAIIRYVREAQRASSTPISGLRTFDVGGYMCIDASSRRNLELTQTMRDGSRKGSLVWVLDRTRTSMGARALRLWIEQPLVDIEAIRYRQDCVQELVADPGLRDDVALALDGTSDLERLTARVVFGNANARDLAAIRNTLAAAAAMYKRVEASAASTLFELLANTATLADICEAVDGIIVTEPPFSVREGGMIRDGVDEELDRLRQARAGGKSWVADFEQRERARTGIKSLKVAFNQVFGYYIEITKANLPSAPPEYVRKQTLANAERYITPELKEYEELILGADDRIREMEFRIFQDLRVLIAEAAGRLQKGAACLAEFDVYVSLAEAADRGGYVRPNVDGQDRIHIEDGRHPVVEAMLTSEAFVANSCHLDRDESFIIITGPNMAGKSTFIRQVALITLMSQIGSFVPASRADIGVVDRIFTRVGASDDLATGRSTFMVELSEVANILHHATPRSLVILDEIGRGTSTFDGLSIAWAVTEYIHDRSLVGAKSLFATHYHELTELEKVLPGVRNFSVAIKQVGENIVFLRRIVRGGAGRSFGIEVARLAGLPMQVVDRAREILANLEQADDLERKQRRRGSQERKGHHSRDVEDFDQLGLFAVGPPANQAANSLVAELASLEVDNLTPVQALLRLEQLKSQAKEAVLGESPRPVELSRG